MSESGSDGDGDSEVYNVECILAESFDEDRQCPIYLVKWEGYDLYDSTWEARDSFEEGADTILWDWRSVKQLRRLGKVAAFDIDDFEIKRQAWVARQSKEDVSDADEQETAVPASTAFFNAQQNAEDDMQSSRATMTEVSDQETRMQQENVTRIDSSRKSLTQKTNSQAHAKEGHDQAKPVLKSTTQSDRDIRKYQGTQEAKKPILDENAYTLPETIYTSSNLKSVLKRKFKTIDPDGNAATLSMTPSSDETSRALTIVPDDVEPPPIATEDDQLASNGSSQTQLAQLETKIIPNHGLILVSNEIAENPLQLFDLIVKTREHKWGIKMAKTAYQRIHDSQARESLDYQTLRDRQILEILEQDASLMQLAAQERLINLDKYRRFVVIAGEKEQFEYIPEAIEVCSVATFEPSFIVT